MAAIGAFFSGQVNRVKDVANQQQALTRRQSASGPDFPGSGHRPADRKTWMAELGPERLRVHQVVWPGTHDSATNKIGIPFITRPFAQCQSLSVYHQLATGCRLLDVRVQKDRRVCHGPLVASYTVDVVIDDVRRFLSETASEVLVLEVRTETDNPVLLVEPVTRRIHRFARFFIAQAFARGLGGKLQVFSTDFIDGDFVDACAGVTKARVDGAA
ncbi:1-phosphatidylinositol phosphodiesterase [Triticum urartu]|uniref:1-phosphatidylinositol phosphodiesterase n=1 Tax=Triticum urartu TaxID=4572 RepID=M7ZMW1_TRIUA|nr:1-phosphatidylinositol phosphodiesterase [Triticum urartu]